MGTEVWAIGNQKLFAAPHRLLPVAYCLILMLSGCTLARVSVNDPLHPEDVAFIVPGQTSFVKVVNHLGAPDSLNPSEDGVVATYYFLDAKYSRVNFGRIARFWSPVDPDFAFGAGGLALDMYQVQFDRNWIARASSFAYHTGGPRFNAWPFTGATSGAPSPKEEPRDEQSERP